MPKGIEIYEVLSWYFAEREQVSLDTADVSSFNEEDDKSRYYDLTFSEWSTFLLTNRISVTERKHRELWQQMKLLGFAQGRNKNSCVIDLLRLSILYKQWKATA